MTMTPTQFAALNQLWAEEVASVLASEGLPWVATACWCNQRGRTLARGRDRATAAGSRLTHATIATSRPASTSRQSIARADGCRPPRHGTSTAGLPQGTRTIDSPVRAAACG